jgi:SAM-dependent methyltransferase
MGSFKSLAIGRRIPALCGGAVIAIFVLALGPKAAWVQDIPFPQPRIDDELNKQDKIYRSRGADVPAGYITTRGLAAYTELLPAGFCDALRKLGSSDRWLDIGAGTGQAILDYHSPEADGSREKCAPPGDKAGAVAISIEDRRTDKWRQRASSLGDNRIRYLPGKRLREYSPEELGKFQIITDVFGGFTYTDSLSRFVDKVLSLLEVGGSFYTLVPGVKLEDGKEKLGVLYLTELEDAGGRPIKICSWLKKTTCTQVDCESKSDWKRPTELIHIRKVCSGASVPAMKAVEYEAGLPPTRRFQLQ